MTTFVLVPGMWLGGWAWQDVTEELRTAGHCVYPMTLTGLGERVHLGGPQVNLDTHIADIANLLYYEDLQDVVLVGHSFSGTIVTAAADQVPERIAHLIYVDTWPLPAGMAQLDMSPSEAQAEQEQQVATQGDGWRLQPPTWEGSDQSSELAGLGEDARRRMRERATTHPFGAIKQAVQYPHGAWTALRRSAILCSVTNAKVQGLVAEHVQFADLLTVPGWHFTELPTGHWPMFSRPHDLAALLLRLA